VKLELPSIWRFLNAFEEPSQPLGITGATENALYAELGIKGMTKNAHLLLRLEKTPCRFSLDIHSNSMHSATMIPKELVAASAEALILSLLSKGESYGYAIIQEVRARSENHLQWTDGMLYPVLHRMENNGWIKSRWVKMENGRKRKYYSLKKDGKAALDEQRTQWLKVHGVLTQLWGEQYA
jgi:PadR family transcriptional regulator, regulatory protein PadR